MIDTAIKYFLVDLCIDAFFKQMSTGLRLDAISNIPKIGDYYSRIVHKYADEAYYGCRVIDIEPIDELPGEYIVYVKFESGEFDANSDFDMEDIANVDDMSDEEVKEYVHAITNEVMEGLTREELEELIYDEDIDMSDVDLVETTESDEVGLSTAFFTFHK